MADYAKLVRNSVALIDDATTSLQVTVQHSAWVSADPTYGVSVYATAIPRLAFVDDKEQMMLQPNMQMIRSRAKIDIIRPIAANGAVGRIEPIDVRDKFTLPNGYTGPILTVGGPTELNRTGLVDPSTLAPYIYEVILG